MLLNEIKIDIRCSGDSDVQYIKDIIDKIKSGNISDELNDNVILKTIYLFTKSHIDDIVLNYGIILEQDKVDKNYITIYLIRRALEDDSDSSVE